MFDYSALPHDLQIISERPVVLKLVNGPPKILNDVLYSFVLPLSKEYLFSSFLSSVVLADLVILVPHLECLFVRNLVGLFPSFVSGI